MTRAGLRVVSPPRRASCGLGSVERGYLRTLEELEGFHRSLGAVSLA